MNVFMFQKFKQIMGQVTTADVEDFLLKEVAVFDIILQEDNVNTLTNFFNINLEDNTPLLMDTHIGLPFQSE